MSPTPHFGPLPDPDFGSITVERRASPDRPLTPVWTEREVVYAFDDSSTFVSIDRSTRIVEIAAPEALDPALLAHPLLAVPALAFSLWAGADSLHAGAIVRPSGVWGVLGQKGAGKSTFLAAMAQAGEAVMTDDLLLIKDGLALRGPRCIDARRLAAEKLSLAGTTTVRGRSRLTLTNDVPARLPLAGFIDLRWGASVQMSAIGFRDRVQRLKDVSMMTRLGSPAGRLDAVALPMFELCRPRKWAFLGESIDAVLSATDAA